MSERPPCKQLFLLVGSNPLPNFLAAIILKPESVCLFYTPETAPVKNRLKEAFRKRDNGWKINETPIKGATDPTSIRESFPRKITNQTHLHYTGGTKPMAAHALMAFHDAGGTDDKASYLDEKAGILRFDDENVKPIDLSKENLGLTIREILGLHGIKVESIGSEQQPDSDLPTAKDAEIIAANVIKEPSLARKLYEHFRDKDGNPLNVTEAKKDKLYLHEYFPGLSINEYPLEKWNSEKYKKWRIFFESAWLEYWCGELVNNIVEDGNISIDIQCKRDDETEREFQIDIALVRGHRLYVISCTTEAEEIHICKNKLFEVGIRARQLGGDLARAAMVSLLHGKIKNKKQDVLKMDLLKGDIADIWESPNEIKAYGLNDVCAWLGTKDDPKIYNLNKWLES
jgi:hypothetical protein